MENELNEWKHKEWGKIKEKNKREKVKEKKIKEKNKNNKNEIYANWTLKQLSNLQTIQSFVKYHVIYIECYPQTKIQLNVQHNHVINVYIFLFLLFYFILYSPSLKLFELLFPIQAQYGWWERKFQFQFVQEWNGRIKNSKRKESREKRKKKKMMNIQTDKHSYQFNVEIHFE